MASTRSVARSLVARLTRWGSASVLIGGVLAIAPRSRAFGLQTLMWGAIDLGIAVFTGRRRSLPGKAALRRILLVNTALDVGYVATGAHLAVRTPTFGGRLSTADARGHGLAVIIQGAALFFLDLAAARRLSR